MINVYQPRLGDEEVQAVREVIQSNWIGKGKKTQMFEEQFAEHIHVASRNILSTNCCSEGLFSSMRLFDIGQGDEVILPTISFVGAGNAICDSGARAVFCDVDPRTLNVRAIDVEKKITNKTKAILLLHYGGIPCEMDEIMQLADEKGLKVIEDSACSVASTYKGKALGTIGDMGMWSFDAMKILVCGDGAMLYFKDPEKREYAEKLLYFGLESQSGYSNSVDKKWWHFDISQFGHRAVMNDITAAVGIEQLKKLPSFIVERKNVHEFYNNELKDIEWLNLPTPIRSDVTSSYYFYHIQVHGEHRDDLAKYLRDHGVYTTFRYYPLHWVKKYGCDEKFPNAEYAAEHTLNIPIHQSLSVDDLGKIVGCIRDYGKKI